jgi:drug/metabolite transporter (DMT)-like permease
MKPVVTTTSAPAIDRPATDPRLIAALAAVYVIWGSTYLAMRIAVRPDGLPPLLMASMRFLAAGGVMLAVAVRRGAPWPSARDWLRVAPIGGLLFIGGNGFVAIAETSVSSGGAAVVCAMMPLWVGVFGVATGEPPTAREWLSLVVGFVGVVVLMGGPSLAGEPVHVALVICAPVSWAAGSLLSRRTKTIGGAHATLVNPALQMLTGGAALAVIALVRGERIPLHASTEAWLALGYLWVFGSLVAFTAYAWLLRNARPAVATSYAYVNPILAVLVGAALYNESLGWTTAVANVLIVGAVVLALKRKR